MNNGRGCTWIKKIDKLITENHLDIASYLYSAKQKFQSMNWTKMELIFESPPGPSLNSGLGPLFRYGTHQTISGRVEQVYLPYDPRLEFFELNLNKCWGGGAYNGHMGIWAPFESPSGPLFISGLARYGVNHYHIQGI